MANHNCFPILLGKVEVWGVVPVIPLILCFFSVQSKWFIEHLTAGNEKSSFHRICSPLVLWSVSAPWNSFFCCSLQTTHKDRHEGRKITKYQKTFSNPKKVWLETTEQCWWQLCSYIPADRHKTSWQSAVFLLTNGDQSGVSTPTIMYFFYPSYLILWMIHQINSKLSKTEWCNSKSGSSSMLIRIKKKNEHVFCVDSPSIHELKRICTYGLEVQMFLLSEFVGCHI